MFTLISGFVKWMFSKPEIAVPILGLDNAGKTTLLEQAKAEFAKSDRRMPLDRIPPTIGMNIAKMTISGAEVLFWDLGGHMKRIWTKYYNEAHGVLYVLDAADTQRFTEAKDILEELLSSSELDGKPILVLANKKDLPDAMDITTIQQKVIPNLTVEQHKRSIKILPVSALTCEGLSNSLQWIAREASKLAQ